MSLRVTSGRKPGQLVIRLGLVLIMMSGLPLSSSSAESIKLKEYVIPGGTLGVETETGGKVQVPIKTIQPAEKSEKGNSPAEKREAQLLERIDELQKRIERLESIIEGSRKVDVSPTPGSGLEKKPGEGITPSKTTALHEQLLLEELGRVRGVIQWQGKPMANGKVRIELENYTGVSLASVKKMLLEEVKESTVSDQGIFLATQTDSKGRYTFEKVPPGSYRLYWWPDFKTGWVHRLREKPDFEVLSGKLTIQDIPEKPTVVKIPQRKP